MEKNGGKSQMKSRKKFIKCSNDLRANWKKIDMYLWIQYVNTNLKNHQGLLKNERRTHFLGHVHFGGFLGKVLHNLTDGLRIELFVHVMHGLVNGQWNGIRAFVNEKEITWGGKNKLTVVVDAIASLIFTLDAIVYKISNGKNTFKRLIRKKLGKWWRKHCDYLSLHSDAGNLWVGRHTPRLLLPQSQQLLDQYLHAFLWNGRRNCA